MGIHTHTCLYHTHAHRYRFTAGVGVGMDQVTHALPVSCPRKERGQCAITEPSGIVSVIEREGRL